jgi:hypothetical protein
MVGCRLAKEEEEEGVVRLLLLVATPEAGLLKFPARRKALAEQKGELCPICLHCQQRVGSLQYALLWSKLGS